MSYLCHVVRDKSPIKLGSLLAYNGAWQRKYQVVTKGGELYASYLGDFYADGRVRYPKRPSLTKLKFERWVPAEVQQEGQPTVWEVRHDPHWIATGRGFCQFWHVVPK